MLGLVILGFGLVVILPIVAALRAVNYFNELSARSHALVMQGSQLSSEVELLGEQVIDMERSARQYQVLDELELVSLFAEKQSRLSDSLDRVATLARDPDVHHKIDGIRDTTAVITTALYNEPASSSTLDDALNLLSELRVLADQVSRASREHIAGQLNSLHQTAYLARERLVLQMVALCLGTAVLAVLFTVLIVRPVRQTVSAIRQLGHGDLERPIEIGGPMELADLGGELEWLRRRLHGLDQTKARFMRQTSHEFKTSLASILEGTELLVDGTTGDLNPLQAEVAAILKSNILQLQHLIDNLLCFNAREEMKEGLRRTRFSLQALLEEIHDNHRLSLIGKRIDWQVDGTDIELHADRGRIRSVVDNLVSNAVKFSPNDGSIRIKIDNSESEVVVYVCDDGPGVPLEDQHRVFEPFYQGRKHLNGSVRGSGLGLAVAKECVEAHGGSLKLESDTHSGGSRFSFTVPAHGYT